MISKFSSVLLFILCIGICYAVPSTNTGCSLLVNDTTTVTFPITATALPFSISALIKVAANPKGSVVLATISVGDLIAELSYSSGQLHINENSFQANSSTFTLTEGSWQYMLIHFKEDEIHAMVQGTDIYLTANYTLEGESNSIVFEGLQGNLKDVAIYNGLLPEDYRYLRFYETTAFTGSLSILSYWRLEEVSGLILYDTIGSNKTTVSISSESIRQCTGSTSKIFCKVGEHYSSGSCESCSSSCLICTNSTYCDVCNSFTVLTGNACPTQTAPTAGTLVMSNSTPQSGVDIVVISAIGWTDTNGIATYAFYYYFSSDTTPVYIASSSSATTTLKFPHSLSDKSGFVVCKATNTVKLSTSISTAFTLSKSSLTAEQILADSASFTLQQQAQMLYEVSKSYGKADHSSSKCNSTYCNGNGTCGYTSAGTKTCKCFTGSYGAVCNLDSTAYNTLLTKAKTLLTAVASSTDPVEILTVLHGVSANINNLDSASITTLLDYTTNLFTSSSSSLTDSSFQEEITTLVSNVIGSVLNLDANSDSASDSASHFSSLSSIVTGMSNALSGSVVATGSPVSISTDYVEVSVSLLNSAGDSITVGTGSNSPTVAYTSEISNSCFGSQTVVSAVGQKYNPNQASQPSNATATDTLSISYYDYSSGMTCAVSGLTDGISLFVPLSPNVDEITTNYILDDTRTCAYFDETTSTWLTDGVTLVDVTSDGISCKTLHTTAFSALSTYVYSSKRTDGVIHHGITYYVIIWGLTLVFLIYWLFCNYKNSGKVEQVPEPVAASPSLAGGDMSKAEMLSDRGVEIENRPYFQRVKAELGSNHMFANFFKKNPGANLNGVRITFFFLAWALMGMQPAFLQLNNPFFHYNIGGSIWMGFIFSMTTNIFVALLSFIIFSKNIIPYIKGTDTPSSAYLNAEISSKRALFSILIGLILIAACTGGVIGINYAMGYNISDYWIGAAMCAILFDFIIYELLAIIIIPIFSKKSALGRLFQTYRKSRNLTFTLAPKFVKVK